MTQRPFPAPPGGYPFPRLEAEVREFWRRERVFERSLEATRGGEPFAFYEGPPTANNVPHVGHVLTRVVKDLFPRYQTMRGRHVERKAGWDTHGLPVEIEVEKRLGISGKREIEQLVEGDVTASIAEFNRQCLSSVMTYERQWRAMTERVGFWVDLDDAYFTYSNRYIESVWWALKTLYERGLLYEGHKSQPFCGRCGTTLSSHEVAQNYKEVEDPSIWVRFAVRPGQRLTTLEGGDWPTPPGFELIAWTTTPWTLPGHTGLAVNPEMVYRVVEDPARSGRRLLVGDAIEVPIPCEVERDSGRERVDLRELPAVVRLRGRDLVGLRYDRPYRVLPWDSRPASARLAPAADDEAGWAVVTADYVTASDGTGLVHTAPAFGAEDYATGVEWGLPLLQTIDPQGKVVARSGLEAFAGLGFKEADREIVRDLKARGLLLHTERHRHNYPFCWRCDQPLLQYATKSWFVRTTAARERLVELNRTIHWVPEHIGSGRFGNWLENVVDWALSRKRYWGTPLPIWQCDLCPATEVIGSFEELFAKAGLALPADPHDRAAFDPHRPFVDEITWRCYACRQHGRDGTFRRVEDVIDAWFDSGSMPFAQHHYPFENREQIEGGVHFPAAFIAEAVDQTRGWFYVLHVLGTLLFDSVAYRHCIVMGHVNDEQGRKMSKRLGNVVEPLAVIEETGADALRWYFYAADPEQPSRFSARLVREAAQKSLLPLWNALSFFTIYANLDGWRPGRAAPLPLAERSDLDRWLLLRLDGLVARLSGLLDDYQIAPAARTLESFLDELTNWYIRRSRSRFWAGNPESRDKEAAYQTLYAALTTLARLLAPFMPFASERLHDLLVRSQDDAAPASVHLERWPAPAGWLAELGAVERAQAQELMEAMELAQRLVALGRAARNDHALKTRQPLAAVTLVATHEAVERLRPLVARARDLILEELNVKEIRWAERRGDYVRHEVRPYFPVLGKRLGKRMKAVQAALAAADGDGLAAALERDGAIRLALDGEEILLAPTEVEVRLIERQGLATAHDRELLVALETALTPELIAEGRAREIVNRLQGARKEAGLDYADRIRVRYRAEPALEAAIAAHREAIAAEALVIAWSPADPAADLAATDLDGLVFAFTIERTTLA